MTEEEKKRQSPYAVNADTLYSRFVSDRPSYAGTYEGQLADLYGKITTRPDFQYDVNKDPTFQKFKDQYVQSGKLAMKDTMGQAAALTGGYGSSYGQAVGQQAYDAHLERLGDVVPELYSQAYGRWQDEGDRMLQQYALLGQQRDTEYNRFREELGDWERERSYQTQMENQEYNRQQNNYTNLYRLIGSTGYTPTDEELAAAGMSRQAAMALQAEYLRQFGPADTGGRGGGGSRKPDTAPQDPSQRDDLYYDENGQLRVVKPSEKDAALMTDYLRLLAAVGPQSGGLAGSRGPKVRENR